MNHHIARTQPCGPEGTGGTFIHHAPVFVCQRDVERVTCGAGGFVDADQTLGECGKVTAKGRVLLLILPDLVLLCERQQRKIGQVTNRSTLDAGCRELGPVKGRRGPDILKLSLEVFIFYLA